ncbi:sensor histidine kinase [Lacticaseibacillus mingshuiensis]|uniref:histidine kinase n=1 Tax=Lacticaseibacillus mingshuiensis TaxID=2799574 RepID=A0ABW4CJ10_9LACO|nr:HAMP domain-containing sensor histidine kinase [Lacticaseibacillus mingshuiensis]
MLFVAFGLAALALILGVLLGLVLLDLRRMTRDLTYLNGRTTNAGVTTYTALRPVRALAAAINASLIKRRQLQAAQFDQQQKVHRMLTNLTHDIKTPLTVATGYVQLLARDAAPAQQDAFRRVQHNLGSVDYYLTYLLDFNLIQEKSASLDLSDVDLSALVETALFNDYDKLTEQKINVVPHIETGLHLHSDQALLRRIVQNALSNWLKYAARTATVSLDQLDAGHIQLRFDNETDAPVQDGETLTTRFYTSDQARTQLPSNGLGLNIIHTLATTLGGTMAIKTEPGHFSLTLIFKTDKFTA